MTENARGLGRGSRWTWWSAAALLAAAVVIDAIDGEPLKLATSGLLLAACVIGAATTPPRHRVVRAALVLCLASGAVLIAYRIAGPGL